MVFRELMGVDIRSVVPEVITPTVYEGCNYVSLPLTPASGTTLLI